MNERNLRDATLLIVRILLGAVFLMRAWNVWFHQGLDTTTQGLLAGGVPAARAVAVVIGVGTVLIAVLLGIGLLSPFAAGLALLAEIGAMWASFYYHLGVEATRVELHSALVASLLVVVVFGPGRASLDYRLGRRSRS